MNIVLPVKYSLLFTDFNETWIFSTDFRKIHTYQISRKYVLGGAEFFHADGRTDMMEANSRFSRFCQRA
jgi:hypothetical protein